MGSVQKNVSSSKLMLMITIVNRKKADYYMDLIQSFDVNMQCVAVGEGTADRKMLDYLGLTDNAKSVIFSVIRKDMQKKALETLEDKFMAIKDGKGIAYTIPLSSVIGAAIFGFLSDNRAITKTGE